MGFFEDLYQNNLPAITEAATNAVKQTIEGTKNPLPSTVTAPSVGATTPVGFEMNSFSMTLILGVVAVGAALLFKKKG